MGAARKLEGPAYDYTEPSELEKAEIRDYWDWARQSLCATNPRYFTEQPNAKLAKFMCEMCPVKQECLLWSLIYNEDEIWGGLTKYERDKKYTSSFRQKLIERAKSVGQYYTKIPLATFVQEFHRRRAERLEE